MRRIGHSLAAAVALAILAPAHAQERQARPVGPEEDLVEQLAPGKAGEKTTVLPPAPPPPAEPSLVALPRVAVSRIVIDDGSVLSAAEVAQIAQPFTGRKVAIEELEELRRRLSLVYFDRGYVNSGVVLPDQEVTDGVIHFREIRGELTEIHLTGNQNLKDWYITSRISVPDDAPLNINELQTSLQLLEQEPMIGRMNARLLPGALPGDGILKLDVTENRSWQVVFGADNHRSPAVGGEQASVLLRSLSLSGHGDALTLYGSYSDGYGDAYGSYSIPVNSAGTTVQIYGSTADSDIVEAPFDQIDIESETESYGFSLTHPFHRSLTGMFSGYLGLEFKHNENTLLGEPFSFTPGERDGETDASVVYGGVEFAKRTDKSVTAMRVGFRRGIDKWDATKNEVGFGKIAVGPDGIFTTILVQGQHIRNLEWRNSRLIARATFQRALDALLSMEKLPMGGANTVRGYRENLLVRDNGVIASLEWQMPLFITETATDRFDPRRLTLATFFDYGMSWDTKWENRFEPEFELPSATEEYLASIGLGLLWDPLPGLHAEVYWGHALQDFDTGGDDLQDDGLHFRVSWSPWN
jgi:hemolysin activation/secretion protein